MKFFIYETDFCVYFRKGSKWKIPFPQLLIYVPKQIIIYFLHQTVFVQSFRREFSLSVLLDLHTCNSFVVALAVPYLTSLLYLHKNRLQCPSSPNVQVRRDAKRKKRIKNPPKFAALSALLFCKHKKNPIPRKSSAPARRARKFSSRRQENAKKKEAEKCFHFRLQRGKSVFYPPPLRSKLLIECSL